MSDLLQDLTFNILGLAKNDTTLSNQLTNLYDEAADNKSTQEYPHHVYSDLMVPEIGNLYSLNQFMSENPNSGVFVIIDINDFNSINMDSGFKAGDDAMRNFLQIVSKVAQESGLKAFRLGGGTVLFHAPSPDKAALFVDTIQNAVAGIGMINGKHKLSISVGTGYSKEHAEHALFIAKRKLYSAEGGMERRINLPGQELNCAHSLLHENPSNDWTSMLGYSKPALHEQPKSILPKEVKSPLKAVK